MGGNTKFTKTMLPALLPKAVYHLILFSVNPRSTYNSTTPLKRGMICWLLCGCWSMLARTFSPANIEFVKAKDEILTRENISRYGVRENISRYGSFEGEEIIIIMSTCTFIWRHINICS
jgi:hypothetical protein